MLVLDLALKSLRNRAFSTSLTVGSIALSVALGLAAVAVGYAAARAAAAG